MFILEINPLVLPDIGLVFWNAIAFLVLLFVLGKFAWKPMLKAINERESGIEEALLKADKMKAEITAMQNENEALLAKAREERATIIKEAKEAHFPPPPLPLFCVVDDAPAPDAPSRPEYAAICL